MPAPVDVMLWAVGQRFGFDGHTMEISRLRFWYRGHVMMSKEERKAAGLDGE
jgi:hypothetical protein